MRRVDEFPDLFDVRLGDRAHHVRLHVGTQDIPQKANYSFIARFKFFTHWGSLGEINMPRRSL